MNLIIFTIYNTHTKEFPGFYVLRPFTIDQRGQIHPGTIACISTDLEMLRQPLSEIGAVKLEKDQSDAANILETWI